MFPTTSLEIIAFEPKKLAKFLMWLCFKVSYNMAIADEVMSSYYKVTIYHGYTL